MSARSWCFTLNNPTGAEVVLVEDIECRYIIFGFEKGDAGTPHLQGYIEFHNVQRMAAVKKIIPRAHWEKRWGNRKRAREYCMKEGEWIEKGIWEAGGQGARTDIQDLMKLIKEKTPKIEIMEEHPDVFAKNMRFAEKYQQELEKVETRSFRKLEVNALIGDAGCGKTRVVHDLCPDVFTVNCGEVFPFDGYDGEKEILLDDFYGNLPYHEILRILDGHQYKVNIKGGHRYAQWTKVFITSNKPAEDWYKMGLTPALARRIHHVTMFCNEVECNTKRTPLEFEDNIMDI